MSGLWLVGKFIAETPDGNVWDFQGIFTTKKKAIAACKEQSYFVAPVEPNEELRDETMAFPKAEYPKRKR